MSHFFFFVIVSWPLATLGLARFFHQKQNSSNPWAGGPISWPKSMWLAYTVSSWFFLPAWYLLTPGFPPELNVFFCFQLLSWWIRGPLELIMIYRWFNWTPKYGISHDLFHILLGATLLEKALRRYNPSWNPLAKAALVFGGLTVLATCAEVWFAWLFFKTRTQKEQSENIYFASEDPRWKFINRATACVVVVVYLHLFMQSLYLLETF